MGSEGLVTVQEVASAAAPSSAGEMMEAKGGEKLEARSVRALWSRARDQTDPKRSGKPLRSSSKGVVTRSSVHVSRRTWLLRGAWCRERERVLGTKWSN